MFSGANEFQGTATAGIGYNVQLAYSFTDHLGITGNFLMANNQAKNRFKRRTQHFAEVGIGYYHNFKAITVEIFGGYGAGRGSARDSLYLFFTDDVLYQADATYNKYFIQPAIGMNKLKNFEWSVSPRIGYLNFKKLDIYADGSRLLVPKRNYFFLEPSANIKIDLHDAKVFLVFQTGLNLPLYTDKNDFNIENFHGVTGLQLKLGNKKE
jgi:hypothetical protein